MRDYGGVAPREGERIYDVLLGAYDAGRGGYVNPVRTTELLEPTSDCQARCGRLPRGARTAAM